MDPQRRASGRETTVKGAQGDLQGKDLARPARIEGPGESHQALGSSGGRQG